MIRRSSFSSQLPTYLVSAFLLLSMVEFFLSSSSAGTLLKYFQMGCLVVMAFLILNSSSKTIKISNIGLCLIVFALYIGLSLVWTVERSRGSSVFQACFLQIAFILMALQFDYDKRSFQIMQTALIIGGVILAILMMANAEEYSHYSDRFSLEVDEETAIDPNNIGGLLAIGFAALFSVNFKTRLLSFLRWVAIVVVLVSMLMTGSRGALLSCIGAALVTFFVQRSFTHKFKYVFLTVVVIFAVLWTSDKLGMDLWDNIMERFEDEGGSGRVDIWLAALGNFWEAPVLGIGLGSSPILINRLTGEWTGSHNTYITLLLEGGIILILLIIILYVAVIRKLRKSQYASLLSILTASIICSFFLDTYNKKIFWVPLLLCCIAAHIKDDRRISQDGKGSETE